MEANGSEYLFNLSLIAITFAAVSALVMLVRQTMGGKLSNYDVHLITTYISYGFAQAIGAILPPLIALFELPQAVFWAVASGLAAALLGAAVVTVIRRRQAVSSEQSSWAVRVSFFIHGAGVVLLMINAVVWPWQGIHLFATALTLSLVTVMWTFVRRIASLLGDKPGEDWDPKRG